MPINQSHELQGAYEKAGLDVTFDVVHGAAHGGEAFFAADRVARAVTFLRRTIGDNASALGWAEAWVILPYPIRSPRRMIGTTLGHYRQGPGPRAEARKERR